MLLFLLIHFYSDEDGRYFDFSRVSYSKFTKIKKNYGIFQERPLEDYNK